MARPSATAEGGFREAPSQGRGSREPRYGYDQEGYRFYAGDGRWSWSGGPGDGGVEEESGAAWGVGQGEAGGWDGRSGEQRYAGIVGNLPEDSARRPSGGYGEGFASDWEAHFGGIGDEDLSEEARGRRLGMAPPAVGEAGSGGSVWGDWGQQGERVFDETCYVRHEQVMSVRDLSVAPSVGLFC